MELQSKVISLKISKGRQLLDQLEAGLAKQLKGRDVKLRYFVFSAGRKSAKLEVSYLKE